MADILMVAHVEKYPHPDTINIESTRLLSAAEFWQEEEVVRQYNNTLWKCFKSRGKHGRISSQTTWVVTVFNQELQYVSFANIIVVGEKWLLEYVMTDPAHEQKGHGVRLMRRVTHAAKRRGARWIILNCDPKKYDGHLKKFYEKFGFIEVP